MPTAQRGLAQLFMEDPMQPDVLCTPTEAAQVVHVVGEATNEVFSFLGPASAALARRGVEQAVVMIDEPRNRPYISSLHKSVDLVLVPSLRNPFRQLRSLLQACRSALAARNLHAVHLHGLLPSFVSAGVVRATGLHVPIYYSPHGSRSFAKSRSVDAVARWLFQAEVPPSRSDAIVNVSHETPAFDDWKSVQLVENPVADVFFTAARHETPHPLIVAGGRGHGAGSAEYLAQLAVLLGGAAVGISFNWLGSVDAVSRARLSAANVGVFEAPSAAHCAAQLAAAWVYVAPGSSRGFEFFLAEAMAAGLPCVAMDCLQHRALIRDGETGFLCQLERDMIGCIAALVDSPVLRARIGQAARAEAKRRFAEDRFSTRLVSAYALPSLAAS
jgi:glycosyltransferase involved in cell wall biosynthesis